MKQHLYIVAFLVLMAAVSATYTGIAPVCTGSSLLINQPTSWINENRHLACDVTIATNSFTVQNSQLTFDSTDARQYGMTINNDGLQNTVIKFDHATVTAQSNFTYLYHVSQGYEEGIGGITLLIYNSSFSHFGQYYGELIGGPAHGVGIRIDVPTLYIVKDSVFDTNANSVNAQLKGTGATGKVYVMRNKFTNILSVGVQVASGSGNNFFIGNNTFIGRWTKYDQNTRMSIGLYSANVKGMRFTHNNMSYLGYSTDMFGPGHDGTVVHDNYIHNARLGQDFVHDVSNSHIYNERYENLEQMGVLLYGNSNNNLIENIYMYNVTPDPRHAGGTANGQCIWLPEATSNGFGPATGNTFRNITCVKARICISASNEDSNTYSSINCTNTIVGFSSDTPTFAKYASNLILEKSSFARVQIPLEIEASTGISIRNNNFFASSGAAQVDSASAIATNNYFATGSKTDANHDGFADNAFALGGTGGVRDLQPRTAPVFVRYPGFVGSAPTPTPVPTIQPTVKPTVQPTATPCTGTNCGTIPKNDNKMLIFIGGGIAAVLFLSKKKW